MKLRRLARWTVKGLAAFAILAAFGFSSLWIEHRIPVTLPAPTGPFAVGRIVDAWADDAPDTLAPAQGAKRELLVWIWYPSIAAPSTATAEYLPAPLRAATERARGSLISNFLTRDLSKVRAHSLRDAAVSPRERSYPVVIMRAGASGGVANYSVLAEDLASHGYVVVGFDAPYRTAVVAFPDGRVIEATPENSPELCRLRSDLERDRCVSRLVGAWMADIDFVLRRLERLNSSESSSEFAGRLDLARLGVFGHSFGGATALQFCHEDPRCKAGANLDGAPQGSVIQEGVRQPFMFLLSDHSRESDPESLQIMANIQSIYDRQPAESRLRVAIRGANHFAFSDDGAVLKSHALRGLLRLFGKLRIDGRRQVTVTAHYLHSFFDACLKEGGGTSRVSIPSSLYPEIEVLD